MKRSTGLKLMCGLAAAIVVAAWCSEAVAYPPFVVVRPPVVVRPYPVYSPVVVRSYPVYPVVYREPAVIYSVPSANPAPAPIHVTLVNPESTVTTLSFTIRGTRYVLAPGAQQELQFGGPRSVEFDRGDSFGVARYPLVYDGLYAFTATERGWTLRRLSE
jgi:hypothetical protein